jgi:SM-20-related protein
LTLEITLENTKSSSQDFQFEVLIEGLLQNEVGHHAQFFSQELITGLRNQLLLHFKSGNMHPAGIGNKFVHQKNVEVRGDVIKWIDNDSKIPCEKEFLKIIQDFVGYLNRTCYTGINDFEFHYALYDAGSFYKPHIDQFKSDFGRKFSFVVYLNEDWKKEDGGSFVAYTNNGRIEIPPESGTVCFFASDKVKHEVKAASRKRMSIAGWLKKV